MTNQPIACYLSGALLAQTFESTWQQLGLKLDATKAPVDVLVIDKVSKPSEN